MSKVLVKLLQKLAGVGRAHNKDKKLHPTDLYCRVVCLLYTKNDRSKQGHKNAKGQSMVTLYLIRSPRGVTFCYRTKSNQKCDDLPDTSNQNTSYSPPKSSAEKAFSIRLYLTIFLSFCQSSRTSKRGCLKDSASLRYLIAVSVNFFCLR